MRKTSGLKPGQKAPRSGQYQQIGPRGGRGPEVNVGKGRAPSSDANSEIDLQAGRSNQAQIRGVTAGAAGRVANPALQAKRNDGSVENTSVRRARYKNGYKRPI